MNTRAASWLAWSLWALSLALTALSLVLLFLNLSHPDVPVYSFWAENVLYSVGFSTVGVVIVPRILRENPIGWLFCAIGFLWAVLHFRSEYAIYTLLAAPGSLPAGEVASWIYSWLWIPGLGLVVFLGLLFPNWTAVEQSLEVVRMAQHTLDVGGNGLGSVLSWADRRRSTCHS
jgi:hypothetical protein